MHGQIAETVGPRDADPVEHYLRVIADKTGSLIGTAARFGAMFSGADPAIVDAATEYGDTIGVAFQLSDDLLDIASDTAESGKTPGTDLREGVPTLPVLYVLADDAHRSERGTTSGDPGPWDRSRTTTWSARRWSCCANRPDSNAPGKPSVATPNAPGPNSPISPTSQPATP